MKTIRAIIIAMLCLALAFKSKEDVYVMFWVLQAVLWMGIVVLEITDLEK